MEKDEKVLTEIKTIVRNKLDLSREVSDSEIIEIIDEAVIKKSREVLMSANVKVDIANHLFNSLRRLDVLQPLIEDQEITEIMINGKDNIFIEKEGKISKVNITFITKEKLEDLILSIVSKINRSVNEAEPICDARLDDGSRVNIVLPPIALNGPILTIRKFSNDIMTMNRLIGLNAISKDAAVLMEKCIKAKYNVFICGGTGSGKTTFLNILSNYIQKDERIITIEDSAELQITNVDNVVSLETRNPNAEGKGKIEIKDLIKASLRMRPDRIVVSEVRGVEAIDMLQAMNTGHDGSLSTGHGNSTRDMLRRLEIMILSGNNMPIEAIRAQIASSLDIIVHLGRMRDKSRKVIEIVEVVGYESGEIILNPLFEFVETDESTKEKVHGNLEARNNLMNQEKLRCAGLIGWED
jgi:pilus assembly protein CpaF